MRKVILITGSSSGLGKYLTEGLAKSGFRVYAGIRDPVKLKDLFSGWRKKSRNIIPVKLDITDKDQCKSVVKKIVRENKRIDVLINNAGINGLGGRLVDGREGDLVGLLDTNTVGAFRMMKSVLPHMIMAKNGRIINITSLNATVAFPGSSFYTASKFALEGLGLAVRREVSGKNVWVTNLAPSVIKPETRKGDDGSVKPVREKNIILKFLMPMVRCEDIYEKVVQIIKSDRPPAHISVGSDARLFEGLQWLLPQRLFEKVFGLIVGKGF